MKKGTKEFYDLIEQFEKSLSDMPVYIGVDAKKNRSPKESKQFYDNGRLNDMFTAYIYGWGASKTYHRE